MNTLVLVVGAAAYRGAAFLAIMYFATIAGELELAHVGLILTVASAFAATLGGSIGVLIKNKILWKELTARQLICYLLFSMAIVFAMSAFVVEIIACFTDVWRGGIGLFLFLGASAAIFIFQQISFARNKFLAMSVVNIITACALLIIIFTFKPSNYVDFVNVYGAMVVAQAFACVLFLHGVFDELDRSPKILTLSKDIGFTVNYALYSLSGMPSVLLVQSIVISAGGMVALAPIVILTQIGNMLGFFNQQLMVVFYNKLALAYVEGKKRFIEVVLSSSRKYFSINLLVGAMVALVIYFMWPKLDYAELVDLFCVIAFLLASSLVSLQWLVNDIYVIQQRPRVSFLFNISSAFMMSALVWFFYNEFKVDSLWYVVAFCLSRAMNLIISSYYTWRHNESFASQGV